MEPLWSPYGALWSPYGALWSPYGALMESQWILEAALKGLWGALNRSRRLEGVLHLRQVRGRGSGRLGL